MGGRRPELRSDGTPGSPSTVQADRTWAPERLGAAPVRLGSGGRPRAGWEGYRSTEDGSELVQLQLGRQLVGEELNGTSVYMLTFNVAGQRLSVISSSAFFISNLHNNHKNENIATLKAPMRPKYYTIG